MNETEKIVPINIRVAGFSMALSVKLSEQDLVRDTEKRVNAIFADWERKYPRKTAAELLAMLTFRFASFYYDLRDRNSRLASEVDSIASGVAGILKEN